MAAGPSSDKHDKIIKMTECQPSGLIPLPDQRSMALPVPALALAQATRLEASGQLTDLRQRPLRDLRISVTDRCNFRCNYCMPKEVFDQDYRYLPHASLLSFEEITRLAKVFVGHGVQKIRLTGGEPLLRKNIERLIEQLASLRTLENQPLEVTLTTNGALLARKARDLKAAGLQRVTVSLDALDDAVFRQMNDVDFPLAEVLAGIEAAQAAELGSIKINMVVKRGTNEQEILPMARHFRGSGMVLRFIEYMDVGTSNGWRMSQVMPSSEVIKLIAAELPLLPLAPSRAGETAARWGYTNSAGVHDPLAGEIGVISSVTQAFCASCNRARLSTEGKLYLCLFATQGYDLRALLRSPASESDLTSAIAHIWRGRSDHYSEMRSALRQADSNPQQRVEMSYIGG